MIDVVEKVLGQNGKNWPEYMYYKFGDSVFVRSNDQFYGRSGVVIGYTITNAGHVKLNVQLAGGHDAYMFFPIELSLLRKVRK